MHELRWGRLGAIAAFLVGCTAAQPAPPGASASPSAAPSAAATAIVAAPGPTAAPATPAPAGGELAAIEGHTGRLEVMTTGEPCAPVPMRISGTGFPDGRVSLWLEPFDAPLALRPGYREPHPPFGVQIAEADSKGGRLMVDWAVRAEVGKMSTGGTLRLGSAGSRRVMLVAYGADGAFLTDRELPAADDACAATPVPRPAPKLEVVPPSPCPGQEVELRGTGFPAGETYFDLHAVPDQAAMPLRQLGLVDVGADGRFSYKFRYDAADVKPGMLRTGVTVYDAELGRHVGALRQCVEGIAED